MSTLVDRLVEAAEAAIRNEAPELERESKRLRGVVLELTLGAGQCVGGTMYVERRVRLGAKAG